MEETQTDLNLLLLQLMQNIYTLKHCALAGAIKDSGLSVSLPSPLYLYISHYHLSKRKANNNKH